VDEPLAAGRFSVWLDDMEAALRGERDADVPCDGCTACCRASQFVHVEPDETDALAHIPAELLFPAPRRPAGHMLLGYDEHGWCPMLVDGGCSIYEHRPRACRTYDCRIFAATGVELEEAQADVAARVRRWVFTFETEEDTALQDAVRAAARFVLERDDGSRHANQLAVRAIERRDGSEESTSPRADRTPPRRPR
jgi:Fe-S-cluster containining protein